MDMHQMIDAGLGDMCVGDSDAQARLLDGIPEPNTHERIAVHLANIYRAAENSPQCGYIRRECKAMELLIADLGSQP